MTIYFNSDRSGTFNLYRYDIASRQTRQITHSKDWDVRWPSADGEGQIVYESGRRAAYLRYAQPIRIARSRSRCLRTSPPRGPSR